MLIKEADDQSSYLAELEGRAKGTGIDAKRAETELRIRRAGLRGEREAAYLIDFDYAPSPNWAVIHDLRVEHRGRVAQIDHLLINRWMDLYVLETKSFQSGVKITEDGEFLRWNDYRKTYEAMASPIEQNERHIQVLRDVVSGIELPTRLGMRIAPAFHSFVLISATAKIFRPKRFDSSRVIKADQLKRSIWRDIDSENGLLSLLKTAAKIVSGETVEFVARQLAAMHRPLRTPAAVAPRPVVPSAAVADETASGHVRSGIDPAFSAAGHRTPANGASAVTAKAERTQASAPSEPRCKACQSGDGSILSGKYGYYFKCAGCTTNTAIRFTCQAGHNPRLRGERGTFYRECAECGSSEVFHRNPTGGAAP